jgi:hypothetical protein
VDLSAAAPEELEDLLAAAGGALAKQHFACKLDEELPRILDAVRPVLFVGGEEKANIRTELRALGVYGMHSAARSWGDAGVGASIPSTRSSAHGKKVLGSLVVTYPTSYIGGELRFTRGERDWTASSAPPPPDGEACAVTYAVFLDDAEYAMLPVTSGYRVAVTYGLHLAADAGDEDGHTPVPPQI